MEDFTKFKTISNEEYHKLRNDSLELQLMKNKK